MVSMKTLAQRIIEAREAKGLLQYQLADAVGIKQQSMQAIESGSTKMPRNIEKIAQILEVTPEWLLWGKGNIISLFPEKTELPSFEINHFNYTLLSELIKKQPRIFIAGIKGFAMIDPANPKQSIDPGDFILVDPDKTPINGDIVLAKHKDTNEVLLRRYIEEFGHKILESTNRNFKPIPFEEIEKIYGVVIQKMQNVSQDQKNSTEFFI